MHSIKHRLIFILLASLFILAGCKRDKGTPAIEKDKMAAILTEIYLTQSTLEESYLTPEVKKEYYYANILEQYGVSEELFDSAVAWYASNMDVYEDVYRIVLENLEKYKTELEQSRPTE